MYAALSKLHILVLYTAMWVGVAHEAYVIVKAVPLYLYFAETKPRQNMTQ